MSSKIAVVLANLGGPDSIESVVPFLFNLFYDRHIIDLPNPLRYFLAQYISRRRAPIAREIYSHIGGKSPILDNTMLQAKKLEDKLNGANGCQYKVFVMMSYWHPFAEEAVAEIAEYGPKEVVFLPLYPQYSASTTLSAVSSFKKAFKGNFKVVCCYYDHPSFIKAHCNLILQYEDQLRSGARLLFSAHGVPLSFIEKGDPYQIQIEKSVSLIVESLDMDSLDWVLCYQSKVGRKKWLSPGIEEEIKRANNENLSDGVVVVPIAFVSDHSETIVELDIEYRALSKVPFYRVKALGVSDLYIDAMSDLVTNSNGKRFCSNKAKCWKILCRSSFV